jgi:ribosome-associated protein
MTIPTTTKSPTRDDLLDLVTGSLDDDKAEDIVAIDLAGKSSIGDHMVIASGRSTRQVAAMADHLVVKLKQTGVGRVNVEGLRTGDWVLIDAGDIIVHLFRPEVREFYALEKMWGVDVGAEAVSVGAEAMQAANA